MRNPFFAIGPTQLKAIEPNPPQRAHVARIPAVFSNELTNLSRLAKRGGPVERVPSATA